jgi:hypothetical protein
LIELTELDITHVQQKKTVFLPSFSLLSFTLFPDSLHILSLHYFFYLHVVSAKRKCKRCKKQQDKAQDKKN